MFLINIELKVVSNFKSKKKMCNFRVKGFPNNTKF